MDEKRTILIAGATGSIGGGAALALAKRGAAIVLLGRYPEKLQNRAEHIRAALSEAGIDPRTADIQTLTIDFSDMVSVRGAAQEALNRFPSINGLVLSVGLLKQNGPTILPGGHELMFATNVMGPFLFTRLLIERMQESDGLVLHVIAKFTKTIDWDDIESVKNHRTMTAFDRTKTYNRIFAGELARRYAGKISSVAFDPTYVIDKSDPELSKRWPSGFTGFLWRMMTIIVAKPPAVAGEPIAELMLSHQDRNAINGAMFRLYKRIKKPDRVMNDRSLGERFWDRLVSLTEQREDA